ncbi:MAG: IspD/TarI family cytidylyltransferase [Nocardioides sp.]
MTKPMPRTAVVLLAAGSGSRVGAQVNKVLLPLLGRPVLAWSLQAVAGLRYVEQVVVVHRPEDAGDVAGLVATWSRGGRLVEGGPSRHASEWHALRELEPAIDAGDLDVVAIHDTARPLADRGLYDAVVGAAAEHGGAIPVRHLPGLLASDPGAGPTGELVAVQTPQAFRAPDLLAAYRAADADGFEGTDTAACVERYTDLGIRAVPCPATNIKITFPEDVALAGRLLGPAGS